MTASRSDGGCWPPHPGPAAQTEQARNQILSCSCYGGSQATSKSRRRSDLLTVSPAPLTGIGLEGHEHRLGSTSSCISRYFLQRRTGNLRNHAGTSVSGRVAVQELTRYVRTSATWSPVMRDWSYAISWERESSPLARGQLYRGVAELRPRRIIPARAGFTKPSASAKSVTTDHPRACGVYVMLPSVMVRTGGSSPRVRGLRHPGAAEQLDGGIIPARAGFTATGRSP